ncbi:2-amino-4-hydroxy-6-hydroxymethyldihydropteridine diphosphokinase [Sagittula sp. S175]|uniref:2-amino-4-hydroxy-6- hydroxymethyldihydropteridine diphosphokinase n=1 Tax=Sagittula sp. S175 TaxID=3415129 RepID=UPI003C7A964F
MAQEFLIALGSNLGSERGGPSDTLAAALQAMTDRGIALRRVSRFYATPCFPVGTGPDYVNACAVVRDHENASDPRKFLQKLHEIERDFGRERVQRWGSRTLDLDLVAMDDAVLPDARTWADWRDLPPEDQISRAPDQLILPHPRLQERAFVLVPLADVAAGWTHPILRQTVAQMRDSLPLPLRLEPVPL